MEQLAPRINGRIVIRDITDKILLLVLNNEVLISTSSTPDDWLTIDHQEPSGLPVGSANHSYCCLSPSDAVSRLLNSEPYTTLTVESTHNNSTFERSCIFAMLPAELYDHLHVHI